MTAGAPPPVILTPAPGQLMTVDAWIGLAIGGVVLVAAAAYARRRGTSFQQGPPRRYARVFAAALGFAVSVASMFASYAYSRSAGPGQMAFNCLMTFLVFLVGGIILFGLADLAVGRLRPRRTGRWLLIAPPLFLALLTGVVSLPVWLIVGQIHWNPRQLMLVAAAATAALVWWSHLPAPDEAVGQVFE